MTSATCLLAYHMPHAPIAGAPFQRPSVDSCIRGAGVPGHEPTTPTYPGGAQNPWISFDFLAAYPRHLTRCWCPRLRPDSLRSTPKSLHSVRRPNLGPKTVPAQGRTRWPALRRSGARSTPPFRVVLDTLRASSTPVLLVQRSHWLRPLRGLWGYSRHRPSVPRIGSGWSTFFSSSCLSYRVP